MRYDWQRLNGAGKWIYNALRMSDQAIGLVLIVQTELTWQENVVCGHLRILSLGRCVLLKFNADRLLCKTGVLCNRLIAFLHSKEVKIGALCWLLCYGKWWQIRNCVKSNFRGEILSDEDQIAAIQVRTALLNMLCTGMIQTEAVHRNLLSRSMHCWIDLSVCNRFIWSAYLSWNRSALFRFIYCLWQITG
jgi:hypothetical protein